ncbi:hypothetical protein B0X78_02405 [bacterium AM6]|nr:hypothetical protein B0X78_02405 [bacterium AM6]
MYANQDWVFLIRGREVIARVEVDEVGAAIVRRYSTTSGPGQTGLEIPVKSQSEAARKIEELLNLLMGSNW